ncbi:MAG: hypothetical protein GY851_09220 [bacterium]|nr:hypothetical protein [bacterium]
MATMAAILADLREEIVGKVYGITPEVKAGEKWNCHEPTSATDFASESGNVRTFKVGWWKPIRYTFGTSYRKYDVTGSIRIHYGKTDEDLTAAASDFDAISRALIDTTPTTTGVDHYLVPADVDFPDPEDIGDGDSVLITIPLAAVIETTA